MTNDLRYSKSWIGRIESAVIVRTIRAGLTNLIPVLVIGAFALVFNSLPVPAYQSFLHNNAFGKALYLFFDLIQNATFGVLSVYMTYSISRSYIKIKADQEIVSGGAVLASLGAFFILSGVNLADFGKSNLQPKSMFLAILAGLGASWMYFYLSRYFRGKRSYLYSEGADLNFNRMMTTFIPIALTVLFFALMNCAIIYIFKVDSFRQLLVKAFSALFSIGKTGFWKGFFFVLLSSILWFFGIHGSDILEEGVMQEYFVVDFSKLNGEPAPNVLTKEFFDCFVLIGGCGTALCLLIAVLLFSKNHSRKKLGYTAALPMLFNINELMVFGLPIIFNPIMLIPFLLVPLVSYTISYFAIYFGFVPHIVGNVEWTTPIFLGGYGATGSIAGSVLQLVILIVGVLIYFPFVRLLDKYSEERAKNEYENFIDFFRKNEQTFSSQRLIDRGDIYGDFAKGLCADLKHKLKERIRLAYQPQYHYVGRCIGVETLLRWEHPVHGMLYPPLVIKLAEEGGFLAELEETILSLALNDRAALQKRFGEDIKLSINVTGTTVMTSRYLQFCRRLNERDPFLGKNICIEVTEQAALTFDSETESILRELSSMGILLAIDDFSMGQTSIHYLKDNLFRIIKLDGSLVRGIFEHQYSREIISSIVSLASTMNLMVLAEFVETNEQKEALHQLGCDNYQGYLYSPAVFLDQAENRK